MNNYFYGWYFRCMEKEESIAVIPAVHLSSEKYSCSIQVITKKESLYREFPISQFRINRKKCIMQIGESIFSEKGIRLKFETAGEESPGGNEVRNGKAGVKRAAVRGILHFGKTSKPRYDIMGPFSCLPGMECRHTVYSMRHTVHGELSLGSEKTVFRNGWGYMEGDSGISFPEWYIWTQHFFSEGSLMVAAASVALGRMKFTGITGFLFRGNKEYRFATYLGASVTKMNERSLLIRQGRYRLYIRFSKPEGSLLKAPESGKMTRSVREDIACRAEYLLTYGNTVLFHERTDKAAAEYDARAVKKF